MVINLPAKHLCPEFFFLEAAMVNQHLILCDCPAEKPIPVVLKALKIPLTHHAHVFLIFFGFLGRHFADNFLIINSC
jgi:hypothetical protein